MTKAHFVEDDTIIKEMEVKGTFTMEDQPCRRWVQQLDGKMDKVNNRTKLHTRQIKELEKEVKQWKQELENYRRLKQKNL